MNTLNPRPVNFKFGDYISQAIELMKKDFGTVFLSFLCVMVMSIIPFCGFMAYGNFYRICYKIDKGIPTSSGEIFNFDDFTPYFILQLYMIAACFLLFIPFGFLGIFADNGGALSGLFRLVAMVFLAGVYFIIAYFLLQAFYIPALITFKKITDINTAWNISKTMTKGNLLIILFFSIVVSFLSGLGVIACFVGLIFTLPFHYVAQYFAFKDGMEQIEYNEINEIRTKTDY